MRNRLFFLLILISFFTFSDCKKDSVDTQAPVMTSCTDIEMIKSFFSEKEENDILITYLTEIEENFRFEFEDGSFFFFNDSCFVDVFIKVDDWEILLIYSDNSEQLVAYAGTIDLSATVNPSGYTPLCARLDVSPAIKGKIRIKVIGKNGALSDVEHTFDNVDTQHSIPILGLYPDYENTVLVGFMNEAGQLRREQTIKISTVPLADIFPDIYIDVRQEDKMEPGFNLFSYRGDYSNPNRPFMVDAFGDIRWVLDYESHPILNTMGYDVGIERLKNGNFYFGDWSTRSIYEIGAYGDIVNSWEIPVAGFHHNVQEKPDGNLLITVNRWGSQHLNGNPTNEDHIYELDRQSGDLVMEWDLRYSLDEYRVAHFNNLGGEPVDWVHVNAVIYDENDNTIIVSGRHQGVIKLDYNNDVKWILAPHEGWGENRDGDDLNQFLLSPLDAAGNPITEAAYLNGTQNHSEFEWSWAQHSPLILPNGNLMVFDNGDRRNYLLNASYSRAVEYQIDVINKTVKQVWEYGKDREIECYSNVVSDVDYLPEKNNILFSPGKNVQHSDGTAGAKVVEVDYATKEVVFEARLVGPGIVFHRVERLLIYE